MKIYLVLEYKVGTSGNVWAETQAFTSKRQQEKAFDKIKAVPNVDAEMQVVEVSKRTYQKGADFTPADPSMLSKDWPVTNG